METDKNKMVFNTNQRIRLGIWGLGRGMAFYETCKLLNIDVVAGCDYNEHMRKNFLEHNPDAFATDNIDELLAQDIDAVLVATFFPAHANDVIKCLEAGKHVLSEVASFMTLAEGVRLVEAVEKHGLVYNLAENYPFTPENMYLKRKWQEGLFGELMYAEFDYVHEIRPLAYVYLDGLPVKPGNTAHNWRSWLSFHYYCTHSLGPIMNITGLRPTRVVSLPSEPTLPGFLNKGCQGMGNATPSLISMSNGSVIRNLMGGTTNDSHMQRLWGTRGASENGCGGGLNLRLGGRGDSPKFAVNPSLDELGELAKNTGHGGGDFWVLYYFAREILYGTPGPFDVYTGADVTIAGIQAYRSAMNNGEPMDIPDFRDPDIREKYRNDNWVQESFFAKKKVFPEGDDLNITCDFTNTMSQLISKSTLYRAYTDWYSVKNEVMDKSNIIKILNDLIAALPELKEIYKKARIIADAYRDSEGARVLREMLELGDEEIVMQDDFIKILEEQLKELNS